MILVLNNAAFLGTVGQGGTSTSLRENTIHPQTPSLLFQRVGEKITLEGSDSVIGQQELEEPTFLDSYSEL